MSFFPKFIELGMLDHRQFVCLKERLDDLLTRI
jgi:hypothetical protein